MGKRAVEVSECDRCGKEPARTWLITGPDGSPREIELCDQHGAGVANAYALGRPVAKKKPRVAGRGARNATTAETAPTPAPAKAPSPPTELKLPPAPPGPIWR